MVKFTVNAGDQSMHTKVCDVLVGFFGVVVRYEVTGVQVKSGL